jgi:cytochrome-b5 reductase
MLSVLGTLTFMTKATLSPFLVKDYELLSRTQLTVDVQNPVYLLRFKLPQNDALNHTLFSHVTITTYINGTRVKRHYSPTSDPEAKGYFEFMVKVYPGGVMSNHLINLPIGQSLPFTPARSKFDFNPNRFTHIGIIAGGVGMAPMFAMIKKCIKETPNTLITLLYANQTERDIIQHDYLLELAEKYKIFKYLPILSQAGTEWQGLRGRIDDKLVKEMMPHAAPTTLIVFCCPKPLNRILKKVLPAQGYTNFYKV